MIIERYIQWKTHKNIHFWDKIRYARLLEANSSISSHLSWYEANYIRLYLLFLIFYIPCNLPAQKFCILHFWTFILKVSLLLYYCVLLFVTIYCLESRFRKKYDYYWVMFCLRGKAKIGPDGHWMWVWRLSLSISVAIHSKWCHKFHCQWFHEWQGLGEIFFYLIDVSFFVP